MTEKSKHFNLRVFDLPRAMQAGELIMVDRKVCKLVEAAPDRAVILKLEKASFFDSAKFKLKLLIDSLFLKAMLKIKIYLGLI